jgi:hypothetical protein
MIYVCVIKLALILFDPRPNNAVIKVSLILALLPLFFIALHLYIGLRTIYRSFGIRSGMTSVRVAGYERSAIVKEGYARDICLQRLNAWL